VTETDTGCQTRCTGCATTARYGDGGQQHRRTNIRASDQPSRQTGRRHDRTRTT